MNKNILILLGIILLLILGVIGYDNHQQSNFEPTAPIVDQDSGDIISTPENAMNAIPPDGIILKDKPF